MREGWRRFRLEELCDISKGSHPLEKTKPGTYPLVGTAEAWRTSETFDFEGQVICIPLVSSTGHGDASLKRLHFAEGKVAAATIVGAAVVRDPGMVEGRFLHHFLSVNKDRLIVSLMQGTANMSLKVADLANVPVDLPPLPEQRRIVDLIGAVDAQIEAADAVSRRAEMTYRSVASAVFASAENTLSLGDFCEVVIGVQRSPKRTSAPTQTPYVRAANVKDGRLDLSEVLTMHFSSKEIERYRLHKGDVLVTEGCGSLRQLGASAEWPEETPCPICIQNTVLRMRAKPGVSHARYLAHYCRFLHAGGGWARVASGSSIFHIGAERARSIPVPSPSLKDQARISRELDGIESLHVAAKREADLLHRVRAGLLRDLLSGAHEIPTSYDRLLAA